MIFPNSMLQMADFEQLTQLLADQPQELIQIFATLGLRRLLATSNNPPFQQTVDKKLIPTLLQFSQNYDSPKLQFEAIWCLTNLASSESRFVMPLVENKAIPYMIDVLDKSKNAEVIEQAIWCIGNISGDNIAFRDTVL